jgi:hypothetical protein
MLLILGLATSSGTPASRSRRELHPREEDKQASLMGIGDKQSVFGFLRRWLVELSFSRFIFILAFVSFLLCVQFYDLSVASLKAAFLVSYCIITT